MVGKHPNPYLSQPNCRATLAPANNWGKGNRFSIHTVVVPAGFLQVVNTPSSITWFPELKFLDEAEFF